MSTNFEPNPTALICENLAIGWQTGLDITSTISPISMSAQIVRSWNGRAKNLAPQEFQLYRVQLSASGDMRPPALSRVWPGTIFSFVPADKFSDYIAPGGSLRVLNRTPHPGSVRCLTKDFRDVDFTVADKTVTLTAPATEIVRIFYRPVLELFVVEPWSVSTRERAAEVSWDLVAEETGDI